MLEETNEPSVRQERAGHEFESLSNTEARSGGFNPGKTIVERESAGELHLPLLGVRPEFPLQPLADAWKQEIDGPVVDDVIR